MCIVNLNKDTRSYIYFSFLFVCFLSLPKNVLLIRDCFMAIKPFQNWNCWNYKDKLYILKRISFSFWWKNDHHDLLVICSSLFGFARKELKKFGNTIFKKVQRFFFPFIKHFHNFLNFLQSVDIKKSLYKCFYFSIQCLSSSENHPEMSWPYGQEC